MSLKKHLRVKRRGRPRKRPEPVVSPTPETLAKLEGDVIQSLKQEGVFSAFQEEAALAIRALRNALCNESSSMNLTHVSGGPTRPSPRDCFDRLSANELRVYRGHYVPWQDAERSVLIPGAKGACRSDLFLVCVVENKTPEDLAAQLGASKVWIHRQLQESVDVFINRA